MQNNQAAESSNIFILLNLSKHCKGKEYLRGEQGENTKQLLDSDLN